MVGIEHDVTYKWQSGGGTPLLATRQIVGPVPLGLSTQVAAGAQNVPVAWSLILSKIYSLFLVCDQAVTLRAGGVDAVQSVATTGAPTGGTTVANFGGQTSAPIPYNATAAQLQAALVAMTSIGPGGVVCTGGPLPAAISCAFAGLNAVKPLALMTFTDGYTGGSSPATAVSTTTAGVLPDTTVALKAGVPLVWDWQGYYAQPFLANVSTLYLSNPAAAAANLNAQTLSNA
jgi:hypothetical protein